MTEYIERAAVEKFIEDGLNNPDKNKAFGHDAIEIMEEIHYMPAADVAPVRHGRWNDINPTVLNPGVNWICRCSLCGCPQDYKHNYCPNCGALMDGKEDEHEAG